MKNERQTIGEMKLETQQLLKLLLSLSDDETLTYDRIRSEIGIDVQNGHRGCLRTAIKNAERQTNRLFGTVVKIGVKRLLPGHSCGELTKSREHIRRTARRAFSRSANVEFDKLTKDERAQLNLERTALHFVAESSTDKTMKKLETAVSLSGDALTFQKTLEHFGK